MIEAICDNDMVKGKLIGKCCVHTELLDTGDGSIVDMYDIFHDLIETEDKTRFYTWTDKEHNIVYALRFEEKTVEQPSYRREYSFMSFEAYKKYHDEWVKLYSE